MNSSSMEVRMFSLFLNEKLFWMNNKTIIEFGFRIIWRIMEIWEGVIRLGVLDLHNSSDDTKAEVNNC